MRPNYANYIVRGERRDVSIPKGQHELVRKVVREGDFMAMFHS